MRPVSLSLSLSLSTLTLLCWPCCVRADPPPWPDGVRTAPGKLIVKLNAADLQALDGLTIDDVRDWRAPPPERSMRAAAEALVAALSEGTIDARIGIIPGFQIWNIPVGAERSAAQLVSRLPWVEYATEDQVGEMFSTCGSGVPSDPAWVINTSQQWALRQVCLPNVWPITSDCTGARIAIIDSGINYEHPDLAANIELNTADIPCDGIDNDSNGYIDDYLGYDAAYAPPYGCPPPIGCNTFCDGSCDEGGNNPAHYYNTFTPQDSFSSTFPASGNDPGGHGTTVAAVIGAPCNDLYQVGVCWDAKIVNIRGVTPCFGLDVAKVAKAFDYCKVRGVKVINCSWGFVSDDPGLFDLFKVVGARGMLAVCAAGNNDSDIDDWTTIAAGNYPARYGFKHVLVVGASDGADSRAPFSNWGKKYVDLFAPGVQIRRFALCDGNGAGPACSGPPSQIYTEGTSFATPVVTGVAALVWSLSPSLSPSDVAALIKGNVDAVPALQSLCNTGGRLNASRAMGLPACH